jgi:hypothetical protein
MVGTHLGGLEALLGRFEFAAGGAPARADLAAAAE